MEQTEDTELRDLVVEALEKNGSLAKIRALLRANIFLAFEEDNDKIKHNLFLDNLFRMPEGILTLSLVHEFLEFCNLKNTLFVYMSETRQGNHYTYEGQRLLAEKLNIKRDSHKEPLLVSLIKNNFKVNKNKCCDRGDSALNRDDQNNTYIVHEDTSVSSVTSQSQSSHSDQSSDDKNKLRLRLPLDNSDTDTSSDSARDKTSSEYIPNEHIIIQDESEDENKSNIPISQAHPIGHEYLRKETKTILEPIVEKINMDNSEMVNSNVLSHSSESTSYMDLNPLHGFAEKMINTIGLPMSDDKHYSKTSKVLDNSSKSTPLSSSKTNDIKSVSNKVQSSNNSDQTPQSDNTPDYTFEFSSATFKKASQDSQMKQSPTSAQETLKSQSEITSPHQLSQSSQSSISISDVADLLELSAGNSPIQHSIGNKEPDKFPDEENQAKITIYTKKERNKLPSDHSGESTDSPIPSLSNLSLDFHSD